MPVSDWTADELERIESAEELEIASRRTDGRLRKPRTIWVVRCGEELYVRSVNGPGSAWFRGVQDRHEGRISAGGIERDVRTRRCRSLARRSHRRVYRSKYGHYSENTLSAITSPDARSTTLELVPRS